MIHIWLRIVVITFLLLSMALTIIFGTRPVTPGALLLVSRSNQLWLRDLKRGYDWRVPGIIDAFSPDWSPDGRWITYTIPVVDLGSSPPQAGFTLAAYNLVTDKTQLIGDPASNPFPVIWSPDSRWLSFGIGLEDDEGLSYAPVRPDNVGPFSFLADAGPMAIWSPESDMLYYFSDAAPQTLSATSSACLSTDVCIQPNELYQLEYPLTALMGWMPDGQQLIVGVLTDPGAAPTLASFNPTDGLISILQPGILPGVCAVWSPDGQALAAALVIEDDADVLVETPSTSNLFLIDPAMGTRALIHEGITGALDWEPGGQRLVFETFDEQSLERSIQLYDRLTSQTVIVNAPGILETNPIWGSYRGKSFPVWILLSGENMLLFLLWRSRRLYSN